MKASAAVSMLLVPVLVVGGGVAALAAASTDYEANRVASVAYEASSAEADSAQRAALAGVDEYVSLSAAVKAEVEHAATLQAVGSDKLDAATVAALAPLVTSLNAALPASGPSVPARPRLAAGSDAATLTDAAADLADWAAQLRAEWEQFGTSEDAAAADLRQLRTGILAVAGSVAATGKSILDASGSASPESRATLTSALARVATHIEEGTDPSADLAAYVTAAKAVQDSHAEAVAAAAAAAAASGGGGARPNNASTFEEFFRQFAYSLCHPVGITIQYPCVVDRPYGEPYIFYS